MLPLIKNKKILLIEPPFYSFFGYERWHYPLTLALVGTYLVEKGNEVLVYDADKPPSECKSLNRTEVADRYYLFEEALGNSTHIAWSKVRDVIKDYNPDIVGITSISAKIESADIVAQIAKSINGNIKTILGGAHAEGMLVMSPDYNFGSFYDHVVPFIPDLVNRKPDKNLIMGIDGYSARHLSSMMTSTGCPSACTFCCNSYNKSFTYRNMASIKEEAIEIKNISPGNNTIFVTDDCFFSNSKHFREVCQILKEEGMKFCANSRIKSLSGQKINDFIESGGERIQIGVESGSQRVLDKVNKKLKISEIIKRTKWLNDIGISWSAFFVSGFPFETIEDLKLTKELIYKIQPTFVSINRFTPYPGTQIFQEYYKNKKFKFRDLFQLHRHSIAELPREVEEYIDSMVKEFDEYNEIMKAKAN